MLKNKTIKQERNFALKIAVCNFIGYCTSVGIPMVLDPLLVKRYFGYSIYSFGYDIYLLAPIIAICTYIANTKETEARKKSILTFMILVIATWPMTKYFTPFPNLSILVLSLCFATVISISVYIHNYKIKFNLYYEDIATIPLNIEAIKIEYETWFRLFLTQLTGVSVIAITHYVSLKSLNTIATPDPTEQSYLMVAVTIEQMVLMIVYLATTCYEFLDKLFLIKNQIKNIKPKPEVVSVNDDIGNETSISQLSLKPGEEDITSTHWYQFWK